MALVTTVEFELAGRGNGWTNVSADVIGRVDLDYGINGTGPNDRVASTGYLNFSLRSAAGTSGVYAPNHSSRLAGFKVGIRVRLSFTVGAVVIRKFVGKITEIVPAAGVRGYSITRVTAVDWMDDASMQIVSGLSLMENVRGDQAFSALLATVAEQPNAIEAASVGQDIYRYAFDNSDHERMVVLSELQRLANSEGGYIYVKGDQTTGGVLTYESRTTRGRATSNVVTFRDTVNLTKLEAGQSRATIANAIKLIVHPREIDAAATSVLYQLRNAIKIEPLTAFRLIGSFYDPLQKAQKVGGKDCFVSSWLVNASADGTGADITASFSNVTTFGPNGFSALLTNNSTQVGYLTTFIVTGRGIYDYADIPVEQTDPASIANYGRRDATIDQPYQNDAFVATDLSLYLLNLWKDPSTQVQRAAITVKTDDDAGLLTILLREPSHRIGVVESKTGIDTTNPNASGVRGFFIHRLRYTIDTQANGAVTFECSLAPVDTGVYWVLEQPGQSEMDWTTRLAFYSAVGHIDTPHTDTHSDVAHGDSAHSDSHTDNPHQDAAHNDVAHSDTAHSDVAHNDSHTDTAHDDVAHTDTAHADSHSDVAHSDIAHNDIAHSDVLHNDTPHDDVAHSDNAHQDVAHSDVAHSDVAHSDVPHKDVPGSDPPLTQDHTDQHGDVPHEDIAHSDVAHSDSHTDVAHSDVAHLDEAHEDTPHSDSPHTDTHTDTAHQDTHNDTAHADVVHSDVLHGDVPHSDTLHSDVAHVDSGHGDAAHLDVAHDDVAHSDIAHSDVLHSDTHNDVTHGDA